jgi:hypothetical protein
MFRTAIKSLSFGAATVVLGAVGMSSAFAGAPSDMKMTEAQCSTLWTEAHAGSSGDLPMNKAEPYVRNFKTADTDGDKKLSETEWNAACNKGGVQTSSASGANEGSSGSSNKTSDRTPGDLAPSRTPGATGAGAAGTDAGQTPGGTSDRTPDKN